MKKIVTTATLLAMTVMFGSSVYAASPKSAPKGYGGHVEQKKDDKKDNKKQDSKKLKDVVKNWFDSIKKNR
jgi:ABC-type transporter MlaC component